MNTAPAFSLDRGFVYVATGTGYLDEARASAASLRQHNPGVPICLITDNDVARGAPFDFVIPRDDAEHKPIDKLLARHCPFERTIFLDTDTRIFGDILPLFAVLERFDLVALQDVNRGWHYELPEVPHAFTEFNTGVIGFRRSKAMAEFFASWRRAYDEILETHGLVNDQPAFRRAVFLSDLRIAPLPSEYHFLGNFPNSALWDVRLIHARGNLDRMEAQANAALGCRAYVPDVGVIQGFRGRRNWLGAMLRTAWRMARLLWSPPTDSTLTHPRKWWLAEQARPPEKET